MPDWCKRLIIPFALRAMVTAYRYQRLAEANNWGEATSFGTSCVLISSVVYSTAYQFNEPLFQLLEPFDFQGCNYCVAYIIIELIALLFQQLSLQINLYLIWFPLHKFVSYICITLLNRLNPQTGQRIWNMSIKPVFSACLGGSLLALDLTYIKQKLSQYLKPIGAIPTHEQLDAIGNQCVICYETIQDPVMLHCGHIFCRLCITKWFETRGLNHRTCPVCRLSIDDDSVSQSSFLWISESELA